MKTLLINPKSKALDALPIPPLGILYIAAYARENGFRDIRVIDDNRERLPIDILEGVIKWADVLGLTGTTSQFLNAVKLAQIAREHNVLTVYGGPHASALPQESARHFDVVVRGEGEETFLEILKGKALSEIRGIAYSNSYTTERPFIPNLDDLPYPARDLIPICDYPVRELKRFDGAYTHMISGRGCSGKCIFCSSPMMWRYPRLMSAERVFGEMVEVYEKYGFRNIHFQDDTFTLSKKRTLKLCDLIIDSGIDFKFSCQTRPDMVDYPLLKRMAEAGCVQIEFGVESGDSEILRTARKGYTKEKIGKAFESASKAGISTYGFFIVGLPGESIWSWLKSIWFALRLKLDSSVWTVLLPYPGTEVYRRKMVKILEPDYANWLYKRPIIKVGKLTPKILTIMRNIADIITNGLFNKGTYRKVKPHNES
jgi:anaerobic magnesium-protoporphyrin IX monomethyl ester cyclase